MVAGGIGEVTHEGGGTIFRRMPLTAGSILSLTASSFAADLVIAMPNWPSGQAGANILKLAIAENSASTPRCANSAPCSPSPAWRPARSTSCRGWRPNFDDLVKRYGPGRHEDHRAQPALLCRAWQGLCRATSDAAAAGIKDVSDLSDPAKTAVLDTDGDGKGEVWIGADTWASTGIERVRANSYGWAKTVTLVEAEEDVAMAAVDAAVATGRPMVFYCYEPHHVFKLHDVVRLTEPPYDPAKWKIVSQADDPLWITKSSAPVAWGPVEFEIASVRRIRQEACGCGGLPGQGGFQAGRNLGHELRAAGRSAGPGGLRQGLDRTEPQPRRGMGAVMAKTFLSRRSFFSASWFRLSL